jgi:ABC-type uncharacterized transport system ATPase subunit
MVFSHCVISISVFSPGELRAVIGPNGAGKTTFLDVITGKVAPSEGDVLFKGRSLMGRPEHRIARLGIGRKFQSPRVFRTAHGSGKSGAGCESSETTLGPFCLVAFGAISATVFNI